ncbi:hypothetical protein M0G43_15230 [Subsaxibacter sp. CAU 1640]|uniref:hypothetical protein n=1 Tax=Subsaxibacter sp. CAU 1640 TaxID=2933271 RepID=UPI002006A42C|nr:hypothetical protein [Subsaxibacter sp. CAU 1640]MCK7591939.1 hypothetical protein [Subsaxibacter sp. CAU 1640]
MTKTLYILSVLFVVSFSSFSQNSINDYKYILIPEQFEFQKEKDQYQINSLAKFLFNKYGYTAYMEGEDLPADLHNNGCLALLADVNKDSGLFKTKLRIDLKDCNGTIIQSSKVGESKEKEFAKAYNLALRDAFETFQNMPYEYHPNEEIVSKSTVKVATVEDKKQQQEIERLKEEIKSLKQEQQNMEVKEDIKVIESKDETTTVTIRTDNPLDAILYAQPIDEGYQLVDSTPKVVMLLVKTGVKDVFSVKESDAIVYKKDDVWMYSKDGNILRGKAINIKF